MGVVLGGSVCSRSVEESGPSFKVVGTNAGPGGGGSRTSPRITTLSATIEPVTTM